MRKSLFGTMLLVAMTLTVFAPGPAGASRFGPSGPPVYPSFPFADRPGSGGPAVFVQESVLDPVNGNPHKWVWKVDPAVYGATGTVTFYDYANAIGAWNAGLPSSPSVPAMVGPGSTGVNDWRVCVGLAVDRCDPGENPFDFSRPSFTQDVDAVPADFLTPDPPHTIYSDWDPTLYHPDTPPEAPSAGAFAVMNNANMDGTANLYKFAFTVAPGTQFMNMQVDRAGNYYVARRDMQWDFIDKFTYKNSQTGLLQTIDTQFNVQPYPISDAYGWCGALPPEDPNSLTGMAGQLTKDIAFDVFEFDLGPDSATPPFTTEVVPSFQMRSFGIYQVDVTMLSFGTRQQFTTIAKGVHQRPAAVAIDTDNDGNVDFTAPAGSRVEDGDPDFSHWFNRVSPFAAGVVPKGAWVINEGTRYMQVVPAGTPGATWHQNKFAGAAFAVRGDMERRVNYVNAANNGWAGDQQTSSQPFNRIYLDLIESGAINPKTGEVWKRADWTDWLEGGTVLDPDAY